MSAYDESLPPEDKHDPGADAPLDHESREIQERLDEHEQGGVEAPDPGEERNGTPEGEVDDAEGHPGRGGD